MTIKIIAVLATIVAFAACTDTSTMTASNATEADFGNSAGSLIKAQTADPATLSNPSTVPVTGVEPDYAGNVVKAMRESVAKPDEVKQPIVIQVGGQ
jgi:type IV pilus biogenesis protein CpaD/CtpE